MSAPVNAARGEVSLGGRRLVVTLGALAELETAFAVDGLDALAARLAKLNARDLVLVLGVLARAAGERAFDAEAACPREAAHAVAAAFRAALGDG